MVFDYPQEKLLLFYLPVPKCQLMTFISVQHGNHILYMLLAQVCGDALDPNSQPVIFKSL